MANTFSIVYLTAALALSMAAQEKPAITFNKNFEGGSLGKIEKLGDTQFRCFVEGQHDERGRNRQANWYYFRMDGVQGREVTLTLTDFVGEYNDKPGSCAMNADTIPVFSYD
ncbi:MAG TPA: M14-type cytosolic carboxypeptidase, partial [Verrucomicrobiae bacterium]